jgi:hypothetical protein
MRRILLALLLLSSACGPLPVLNNPASTDYFGMEPGLVRIYRSRYPLCGKPHAHFLRKHVIGPLGLTGGNAVVVEFQFEESDRLRLHGVPMYGREVFAETGKGFGFYDLKRGEKPETADPERIDIEIPKPVEPGTRMKFDQGEVIVEAVEEVVVAAGRFAGCVRVRTQFKDDANLFWFAPGVGMIRGFSEKKGPDGRPAMEFELVQLSHSAD